MKTYTVSEETANILRHILHARATYYDDPSTKCAYRNVSTMLEYLLHDRPNELAQFDYITDEDCKEAVKNRG